MRLSTTSAHCLARGGAAHALGWANGWAFGPFNHGQTGTAHGGVFFSAL